MLQADGNVNVGLLLKLLVRNVKNDAAESSAASFSRLSAVVVLLVLIILLVLVVLVVLLILLVLHKNIPPFVALRTETIMGRDTEKYTKKHIKNFKKVIDKPQMD